MNILLINHYAGSKEYGMEYRPYYLAREWVKQGHQVTIVGATFSHLRLKNPEVKEDYTIEEIEGIRYFWIKTPKYQGSIKRVLNIFVFLSKLNKYKNTLIEMDKPDLVIASSTYPFDNYIAYNIANKTGAKYVYEIHDIWPLGPIVVGGYSKWHPFMIMMQHAEDFAYKHADKVASLLWNAEEHCKERGLSSGKFYCIPNGYNPEEWSEENLNIPLPKEHQEELNKIKGKIIVGFAGGFAASGAVITLVKAASLLKEKENIHFVIVGKGPEKDSYLKVIEDNKLHNISILPPVPKKMIPSINIRFDVAYLGGLHSILHKYGTSYNKMTDYMLSGKPIVQSVDEPGSIVERVGCGLRVEAENAEAVARAIISLSDMKDADRKVMGCKGKEYVEKNLSWKRLAIDFLQNI